MEIVEVIAISLSTVVSNLNDYLGMRKMCAAFLTTEQNAYVGQLRNSVWYS